MHLKSKIEDYLFNKKMSIQRYRRGYSDSDCWGMNYWLGETLPKMIRNLRDMKHSYPCYLSLDDIKDFPVDWIESESKKLEKIRANEDYEYDLFDGFDIWYFILSRISYCLEQTNDEITEIPNPYCDDLYYNDSYNQAQLDKYWQEDEKIFKYRDKMKDEAMNLIKKYFWNLWD